MVRLPLSKSVIGKRSQNFVAVLARDCWSSGKAVSSRQDAASAAVCLCSAGAPKFFRTRCSAHRRRAPWVASLFQPAQDLGRARFAKTRPTAQTSTFSLSKWRYDATASPSFHKCRLGVVPAQIRRCANTESCAQAGARSESIVPPTNLDRYHRAARHLWKRW